MRQSARRRRTAIGAVWLVAALVAAAQVGAALSRPLDDRLPDLHVYMASVADAHGGGSLYDFASANDAPFTYPPFAGLIFWLLPLITEEVLRWLWTAGTIATVVGIAYVVSRADGIHARLPFGIRLPIIALLLFASAPVSSNIRFGQVSLLLGLLVLLDTLPVTAPRVRWPANGYPAHRHDGERGTPWGSRGVLSGLASAIKLAPLIFIPHFWFSGQRRVAVTATATFVGCTAVAYTLLPADSTRFWLTEIWNVERIGHITTGGNQSLNGLLLRLGIGDTTRVAVAAGLGMIVLVVAFIRAVRAHRNGQLFAACVIVGAASLVVSPVTWTHHQLWLVLAALLVVGRSRAVNLTWVSLVAAVMILPVRSVGAALPAGELWGNARLWLAAAVACLIPFHYSHSPEPARSSTAKANTTGAIEPPNT